MTDFGRRVAAAATSLLLKTGQTIKYETGDDGDLEKGVAKDFTVLDTDQYAGTTNITVNGKTVTLSNNCVQDNNTGLMWARDVAQSDIGPDNNGRLLWKDAVNGEDIWEFAAEANAQSLGGHNDWRVPNLFELLSIVDFGKNNPAIDAEVFPNTPSTSTWSSTTWKSNDTSAWYVAFYWGNNNFDQKIYLKHPVRLVRG